MPKYTRKAQVLFTESQYQGLLTIAEAEQRPLGSLLRDAAEQVYLSEQRRHEKSKAVQALLALEPTEVPENYNDWENQYLEERFDGDRR